MAPLLAIGAALTYGAADFTGGLAARRAPAIPVIALSQAAGLAVLLPALAVLPGHASSRAVVLGAVAGVLGTIGLTLYLLALARGPMGVVAPLAAVIGAVVPVGAGLLLGERPTAVALCGIPLALLAVGLTCWQRHARLGLRQHDSQATFLALAGGMGFGMFFVVLAATPTGSGLWPLLSARTSSLAAVGAILLVRRGDGTLAGARALAIAMGLLDMLANILFLLAVRLGLLTLTGLLASMYPVVVILLARLLLGERLTLQQRAGAALALLALALIGGG